MAKTTKGVTRDAVDPEALALLRTDPDAYIRTTHRKLSFCFSRLRPPEGDTKK